MVLRKITSDQAFLNKYCGNFGKEIESILRQFVFGDLNFVLNYFKMMLKIKIEDY